MAGGWAVWTGLKTIPSTAPLTGSIDVRIWDPDDPSRRNLSLFDLRAMPLQTDDRVGVILPGSNRPAYLYVIWIDSEGVAKPVYPWDAGDLGQGGPRTAGRSPGSPSERRRVGPGLADEGAGGDGDARSFGPRDSPCRQKMTWPACFSGLPPTRRSRDTLTVVGFSNWDVIRLGPSTDRGPDFTDARPDQRPLHARPKPCFANVSARTSL